MDSLMSQQPDSTPDGERQSDRSHTVGRNSDSLVARYLVLIGCALAVLALDQVLKALIVHSLKDGKYIDLLGGLIRLDFTRNSGAAFGLFQSGGFVFAAVAILVSLGILIFYRRVAASSFLIRLALGLILGGALGNLIDRVRFGYVVDYVDLRWWYVFNLADSAIVVGVGMLLLHSAIESSDTVR
jgi:signal peptidase II